MKQPPSPEALLCERCKASLKQGMYKRLSADQVICRDQPSCRQRVLSEELGIDLFTKYPRERTYFEMDVRPENHKQTGWKPIHTEDERVMAAWIYYSWCYPVGLAYAVQIDADDEIMHDRYGKPMLMTHERLGQILGVPRQSVSRATARAEARKELRQDDGQVFPVAKPTITREEREAALAEEVEQLGEAPNTIPRQYRHLLNDLLADVGDECIRTDSLAEVVASCTQYNDDHHRIRTRRNGVIENVCTRLATLLSRQVTFRKKPSLSSVGPSVAVPTSENLASQAPGSEALNELYAAGLGKGALAKLPPVEERRKPKTTDRPKEEAVNPFRAQIHDWMEAHIAIPGYDLEDTELDLIAATIQTPLHFAQFKAAALRQAHPKGWKVFVRIAQQCEKRHKTYEKSVAAGGSSDSKEKSAVEEMLKIRKRGGEA